ncbi:hypothetical protein PR048_030950 [Dryococelus australis]|uniref:Uncharacterized protein n=1 Tax=Dryococelus australis TaxID=614101 RepID=A0ABQ9GAB8_9NEOP|nr:hypothetical protein PR048_030950 [Dryococelus australis]
MQSGHRRRDRQRDDGQRGEEASMLAPSSHAKFTMDAPLDVGYTPQVNYFAGRVVMAELKYSKLTLVTYKYNKLTLVTYKYSKLTLVTYKYSKLTLVTYKYNKLTLVTYKYSKLTLVTYKYNKLTLVTYKYSKLTLVDAAVLRTICKHPRRNNANEALAARTLQPGPLGTKQALSSLVTKQKKLLVCSQPHRREDVAPDAAPSCTNAVSVITSSLRRRVNISQSQVAAVNHAQPSGDGTVSGSALGERVEGRSPLTWNNRIRLPLGSLPDFRTWESCLRTPHVGGFSRGSPVPPPIHSGIDPSSPRFTLIGSQDFDVRGNNSCCSSTLSRKRTPSLPPTLPPYLIPTTAEENIRRADLSRQYRIDE